MMCINFYAKCKKCETEEEFIYIGLIGSEFDCLRCGGKLKNETVTEDTIVTIK